MHAKAAGGVLSRYIEMGIGMVRDGDGDGVGVDDDHGDTGCFISWQSAMA